jgi:hypothetical protein
MQLGGALLIFTFVADMSRILFHILTLSLVGIPAAQGLISLWAATSRRHWFLRALAVWAGIVVLIPIRAYEPAVVLAIESLVIVRLVRTAGYLRQPRDDQLRSMRLQFGLRDLLLFMLLVGLIVVTFQQINRGYALKEWVAFAITGSLTGAVVCVAAGLAIGPRRWLMRLLLATVIAAAVPLIEATARDSSRAQALWEALGALYNAPFNLPSMLAIALAFVELAGFILVGVSLVYFRWAGRSTWLQVARRLALTLAAIECVWLAWLYYQMFFLTPFPPPFAGGTNHYRRIAEIAQLLGGNRGRGPAPGADVPSLAVEARTLLETSNFVELDGVVGMLRSDVDHDKIASGMRELARVFDSDAKTATFNRAAELGVANVRLGAMLNRGGTVGDALVGSSCEATGLANLVQSRASISPDKMQSTIAALQRALAEEECVDIIAQRDAALEERIGGWPIRLEIVIQKVMGVKSPGTRALVFARQRLAARNVLLQADLAIRLYQHHHGQLPGLLSDLVPDFLHEVPGDPFSVSDNLIHYRIYGSTFLLYSVGMDGHDDDGTLAPTNREYWRRGKNPQYDYDLETDTR